MRNLYTFCAYTGHFETNDWALKLAVQFNSVNMPKRVRLTDDSVNKYGFRLLTSGGDLSAFMLNPVILFNHQRGGLPYGRWTDIKVDDKEISAVPDFDLKDEFAATMHQKVEDGYLSAVSMGIDVFEFSDDPALMLPGQIYPTVTKWKAREGSFTDIGANDNSVVLYDQTGTQINLSDSAQALSFFQKPEKKAMDNQTLQQVALALALSAGASVTDVVSRIQALQADAARALVLTAEVENLKGQIANQRKAEIEVTLSAALAARKITETQVTHFRTILELNYETGKALLESMPEIPKVSSMVASITDAAPKAGGSAVLTYQGKTFDEWSKNDPKVLVNLKANDIETFKALFKAQYGKEYKA